MNNNFNRITVLNNLFSDDIFDCLNKLSAGEIQLSGLLSKLFKANAECDLFGYISSIILIDENAFSITCAKGKTPSVYLTKAYQSDLQIIFDFINSINDQNLFNKGKLTKPFDSGFDTEKCVANLRRFYKQYGYGTFINHKAFIYESTNGGTLTPIENTSTITLNELKNYEYEKKLIDDNIVNFLSNLPYSHTLLYGDRGTGKSSTIHAMLNKYFDSGLRIIELNKENMLDIPKIKELISGNPLKFIIFIDDLSLGEYDDKVSSLKASLEGSISGGANNAMIVATSNRRHIVKESFNDRENSIHPTDSMAEQLSLSDRFGLTVNFSTTDKNEYISIISQLAKDRGLTLPEDKLFSLAERWALTKGGRSPRRAKQFIDLAYSCQQRNIEIEF
jgi:hypothetical protein